MKDVRGSRVALAPVAWGICDAPGWGYQMPASRALAEMHGLGVVGVEFGPSGFLPADTTTSRRVLERSGLRAVSNGCEFIVMHDPAVDLDAAFASLLESVVRVGAENVTVAAAFPAGAQVRPLNAAEWRQLCYNLDLLAQHAHDRGLSACLHTHAGTAVYSAADVVRVLDDSRINLCLDTGHLLLGGMQPIDLVHDYSDRIVHVHLKDVRTEVVDLVRISELTYLDAVRSGLYAPYGHGDFDVDGLVTDLESRGYSGWYVVELETRLTGEPVEGAGPVLEVGQCVDYLAAVLERHAGGTLD